MRRTGALWSLFSALAAITVLHPSAASAQDLVTYEVVSDDIGTVDIEYQDSSGRVLIQGVTLPWRAEVAVASVRGAPPQGSQVRADWRTAAAPARWVTVRIVYQGRTICQTTLDVGNATCYGITPRIT